MAVSELTSTRSQLLANIIGDLTGSTPSHLTNTEADLWAAAANAMGASVSARTSTREQIIAAMVSQMGGSASLLTEAEEQLLADAVTTGGGSGSALQQTSRTLLARLANLDLGPTPTADVDLDFTTGSLPSGVTFTRASKGWYFDSTGTLQEAAADAARFDYNPNGLAARGLLIEGARTNGIRNSRWEGAVVNGANLLTNGDFALNPVSASQNTVQNGWRWSRAAGTATPTYSSGVVTLSPDGTNALRISQQLPAQPSGPATIYTVSVDIGSNTVDILIGTTVNGSQLVNRTGQGPGTVTFTFSTTGATIWINLVRTAAGAATIDNVSVSVLSRVPTNLTVSSNTGLTAQVVGTGTEDGMPYFDVRLAGTTAVGGTNHNLFPEGSQVIAATAGQTWTLSMYFRLVGGDTTGINFMNIAIVEHNSSGTQLASTATFAQQVTSAALRTQRWVVTGTLAQATTAFVRALLQFNTVASTAIDVTVRFGICQLELGETVSSPILAPAGSPAATTRAADVASKTITPVTACTLAVDAEARAINAVGTRYAALIGDAADENYLKVYLQGSSALLNVSSESNVSGNFDYNEIGLGSFAAETRFKVAVAQRATKLAASRDGGAVSSIDQPVALAQDRIGIGCLPAGTNQIRGWVRRIRVWSRGLLDFQLKSLSA